MFRVCFFYLNKNLVNLNVISFGNFRRHLCNWSKEGVDLACGMFPFLTEINRVYVWDKPLESVSLTCDRYMHMYSIFCSLLMSNILLIYGNGSLSLA